MRCIGVLCVCLLLVACTGSRVGDSEVRATSSTLATSSVNTATTPSTSEIPTTASTPGNAPTTTVALNTTTGPPHMSLEQPVLVANGEGVFEIDTDGATRQMVDGPVAYAVDDTRGGLLFQIDRGRDWEDFFGDPTPGRSTVLWWIPRGSATPQALLVPTPGAGHSLSLYDTFATEESFAVVYLRHEGEEPPFDGNMADTLRVYDVATEIVTELYRVRGWEWNLDWVSAGAGLISATETTLYGGGCRLLDATTGELVSRSGFPSTTDECVFAEGAVCPTRCALSDEAGRVAYVLARQHDDVECPIAVADVATGTAVGRFTVPAVEGGCPLDLEIADNQILVNRGWDERLDEPALLVDLADTDSGPRELPIAGRAQFVTSPVDIAAPVAATVPVAGAADYYRYGENGLFRVEAGVETKLIDGPVERAWDDRMGGVITSDIAAIETFHLPAGETTPTPLFLRLPQSDAYAYARFTGIIDGNPALFFAGVPEGVDLDEWPCSDWALNSRDLTTGEERRHICLPVEDAGLDIRSFGDGLFVGAPYGLCGGTGTSSSIQFWDTAGNPVQIPANPFPSTQSCAPCELDALISSDGNLLAYRHRPDSFHADSPYYSGSSCGGGAEQFEAWWTGSQDVAAEIVVLDLDSGEELWRTSIPADTRLSDFDGRYLVAEREGQSLIYDTVGTYPSIEAPGQVVLFLRH